MGRNVPRLYCVDVAGVSDAQAEVVLPLGCRYTKVRERIETWRVRQTRDHRWPLMARMQQYYVYPSRDGSPVRIRVVTYAVDYPMP